jgi:hypothetical protein
MDWLSCIDRKNLSGGAGRHLPTALPDDRAGGSRA